MKSDMLRLEDPDDSSSLEAEIRHGMMILKMEQDDPQGGIGAVVRTHFLPTKTQAASLAATLSQWAKTSSP